MVDTFLKAYLQIVLDHAKNRFKVTTFRAFFAGEIQLKNNALSAFALITWAVPLHIFDFFSAKSRRRKFAMRKLVIFLQNYAVNQENLLLYEFGKFTKIDQLHSL